VVSGSPDFMMGYFQLGKCYAAQGKLQDALELLLKAVELDPNEKMAHYQLAQIYTRLNRPDKVRYHMEIFQKLYAQERQEKAKSTERLLQLQKAIEASQ
jgi:tetratricopeptide (TPR) repeat protein